MMKTTILIFIMLLCSNIFFGEKVATFQEINDPRNIFVNGDNLYVSDYPSIYIYSLKDYTLKKKFGQKGEQPGAFLINPNAINLQAKGLEIFKKSDLIGVNSPGRITFFTPDGEYKQVIKMEPYYGTLCFQPLGNEYVAYETSRGKNSDLIATVRTYDPGLKHLKVIYKTLHCLKSRNYDKKIDFFEVAADSVIFQVFEDKIFVVKGGTPDFVIDVFDKDANKLYTINQPTEKIKLPGDFVKRVHAYFRVKFKYGLEHNINNTTFPEYFPAIRHFRLANQKIYVFTYKRTGNDNEVVLLDLKGTLLKRLMLPVGEKNPDDLFPYYIQNDIFYQLVKDKTSNKWELHTTPIK